MKLGIDISTYQAGLSLKKAKDSGIEFVIIRGGFTGTDKNCALDNCFLDFYEQAKNNNIPKGIYYFSRATSYEEGMKEAKFLYDNCLKDKIFEYPIYIDVEDEEYQKKASKEEIDNAIKGFCEYIKSVGGYPGIYCNLDWANNHMNYDELSKNYDFWLADWNIEKPNIEKYKNYGMWQFGGEKNYLRDNKIDNKICDQDYAIKDYPNIILSNNLNNFVTNINNLKDNNNNNNNDKNEINNNSNNNSFSKEIEKELLHDVEEETIEEINKNKTTIFSFIINLFKKFIRLFLLKK